MHLLCDNKSAVVKQMYIFLITNLLSFRHHAAVVKGMSIFLITDVSTLRGHTVNVEGMSSFEHQIMLSCPLMD